MNDVTAPVLDSSTTTKRRTATSPDSPGSQSRSDRRRIHAVLQGKGGIGKTLVANLVTQYCLNTGREVQAFDADPVNASLRATVALGAKTIDLVVDGELAGQTADAFIEKLLTCETDVVLDSGAASFLPISRYLVEHEIAALFEAADRDLVIHPVVSGGSAFLETLKGLEALVLHFPASVKFVVWVNGYFGAGRVAGNLVEFEETPLYERCKDRVLGLIHLRRLPQMFDENFSRMLANRLTFDEALDPTVGGFNTVERQRLKMIQKEIFAQLATVL